MTSDPSAAITAQAREVARKLADFARAWYAGEPDGKDDFRFVAHATGDIADALASVAREERERCAQMLEALAVLVEAKAVSCDASAATYVSMAVDTLHEGAAALRAPDGRTK